jgi:hypothetical protein
LLLLQVLDDSFLFDYDMILLGNLVVEQAFFPLEQLHRIAESAPIGFEVGVLEDEFFALLGHFFVFVR